MRVLIEDLCRQFPPGGLYVAQTVGANHATLNRVKALDADEWFSDILLNPVNGENWWVCDMQRTRVFDVRARRIVMAYQDLPCSKLNSVTVVDLIRPGAKVKRPTIRESELGWFVNWLVPRREPLTSWCFSVPDKTAQQRAEAYYSVVMSVYNQLIRSGQLREG
ncbi:MAG: hypothetical protein B7Z37_26605 [Verrucomicrobia bacterium 12-59-8]|nr:MAG: hypothetical protein B7Z37_26605 [Verrucomicrobia bacterium 12-59-8]